MSRGRYYGQSLDAEGHPAAGYSREPPHVVDDAVIRSDDERLRQQVTVDRVILDEFHRRHTAIDAIFRR